MEFLYFLFLFTIKSDSEKSEVLNSDLYKKLR